MTLMTLYGAYNKVSFCHKTRTLKIKYEAYRQSLKRKTKTLV